jgi:hypothetical protein
MTKKDLITEDQKASGIEGITQSDFEEECVPSILGIDSNGKTVGKGIFDGALILEVKTWFKANTKGELDDKGNLKGLILSKATRVLQPSEVAEYELADNQLVQIFGSVDNYGALLEVEAAE